MKTLLLLWGVSSSCLMFLMLHPVQIAVISIRLEGLDHEGDPSFLVYNAIKLFSLTTICQATFINLVYNIPDDNGGVGLGLYN
jgi:hypothetical protein